MSKELSASQFLLQTSEKQADALGQFVDGGMTFIVYPDGRPSVAKAEELKKIIKVSKIDRDDKAMPIYSVRMLGGFSGLLADGGTWVANHPKIKSHSFKFEFEESK